MVPARSVVLAGIKHCGKTTLGRACAGALGREFVDADALIVQRAGRPIPEIFAQQGEAGFRQLESECLASLALRTGLVIATGGGAVLRRENVAALRANGTLIRLLRPLGELPVEGRPLSQGSPLEKLAKEREPFYATACDHAVENQGSIETVRDRILEAWNEVLSHERSEH